MRISDWSSDVCSSDLLRPRMVECATPVLLSAQKITFERNVFFLVVPFLLSHQHSTPFWSPLCVDGSFVPGVDEICQQKRKNIYRTITYRSVHSFRRPAIS